MSAVVEFNRGGFLFPGEPIRFDERELNRLLTFAVEKGASDIYIKTDRPITARVHGRLVRMTSRRLEHAEVVDVTCAMYGGANADLQLRTGQPIDAAYSVKVSRDQSLRFRWCATGVLMNSAFGISIVLRQLPALPPKLDRSDLHPKLLDGLFPRDGLVLVTGETGAGKSTLLASIIREILENPEADSHIVTFESPIEFVYDKVPTVSCEIDQSAVPEHVSSFPEGVRNALRRDPDVILIGEARDAETIKATVLAAQTGHAVYTTLHSNSVATTFLRLIQAVPQTEALSIMGSLIDTVRVVISQQLVPSTDGRRCAVREFLVFTDEIRQDLLGTAVKNLSLLPLRAGELVRVHGQTMGQHAQELMRKKRITEEHANLIAAAEQASWDSMQRYEAVPHG